MYCTNCGILQQEDANFCSSCGHSLQKAQQEEITSATASSLEHSKDTNQVSSPIERKVYPPEHGLSWSIFLTSIAGSIFWSKNWKRLGKPQHIWWTWVSGMLALLICMFSIEIFGSQIVGSILYLAWIIVLYVVQRSMIPKEIRSITNRIVAGIFAVIYLVIVLASPGGTKGKQSSKPVSTAPVATATTVASKPSTPEEKWNKQELDIMKNGNIQVAIEALKSAGNIKSSAEAPSPNAVFKAPWNYYGKIVKVTGIVAIVQEYPPDSDVAKNLGGAASEIVLSSDDTTFTDYLLAGTSGDLKVGDTVTVYGYPAGQVTADNKLGGATDELVIVGNQFDQN